jgi:hypothetical protein
MTEIIDKSANGLSKLLIDNPAKVRDILTGFCLEIVRINEAKPKGFIKDVLKVTRGWKETDPTPMVRVGVRMARELFDRSSRLKSGDEE